MKKFENIEIELPIKKIFSYEHLEITRKRIQDILSPIESLNVYFEEFSDGILKLSVQNIQRLPIEIIGIQLNNGEKIVVKKNNIIEGKKPLNATENHSIVFNCKNFDCGQESIEKQKIFLKF